jgi:CheY-like chemotaxis protein
LIASESADNYQLPESVRLNFESIRKSIELEASLIDDLLDLTRITTGKIILNKNFVNVHDVLKDAILTTQADQQEKELNWDLKFVAPVASVYGDAVRLQQIFWNVLKNAIKFTPTKGKITIETSNQPAGQLVVRIADTGVGMSAGEIQRIFKAFAQGDHAAGGSSHRFGGLGLGLAISKNLVELHSGKIEASSAGVNQGATFTIVLPLAVDERTVPKNLLDLTNRTTEDSSDLPMAETSVLLVEDHPMTREVMAQLLRRRKYKVFTADSIAKARDIADKNNLDLVISDLGLPDGNGNDLMDELRQRYGLKGIALTGYGMDEDIARGKAAGFVTHLIKPVRIQSLETALLAIKARASGRSHG